MAPPGSAAYPPDSPPGHDTPPPVVVVQILWVKPNTDMEGDDDFIPFYDNHADIFGRVTIDGETFGLPKIDDSDFPHWDEHGPRSGVFEKVVSSSPVPISIDIWEADSGTTGDDDHIKISPQAGKYQLDFEFDLCALTLTGDVNGSAQGSQLSSGGSDDDAATILFRVELKAGRPVSQDDLALVDLDLIQVVSRTDRMVARKGTVVMARIANNYGVAKDTNLRIRISGGGFTADETFPLQIAPGEVKKDYFFADHPISFPLRPTSYPLAVTAEIVDPDATGLPADDCRLRNDQITKRTTWKVVTTKPNFTVLWAKVGRLQDVAAYVPDTHFQEIIELGTGYISAVYPLIGPNSATAPLDIPPPPLTAAIDFLVTVLGSFLMWSVEAFEPIALTFELSALAALLPYDRLLGVLPEKDWFDRFPFWSGITGFSLGEFAPRAVIFLPRHDDGSQIGPQMTLPAHEMGHTFGLSVDPRLKSSWACSVDWPVVGHAPCGITGGFDEYNKPLLEGNPSNGYWVRRGSEPPALVPLAGREQRELRCFMGHAPTNVQDDWVYSGCWIDPADYDQLVDKLAVTPDPEVVYVSGMIAWNNQIHVGRCMRLDAGVPDHSGNRGMYGFRFLNRAGRMLSEVGLPVAWNHAEFNSPLPVTFFAVTLELPKSSASLEIWNRGTGTRLAAMNLERSVPKIRLERPTPRGKSVVLRWRAADRERSKLRYVVLMSPDGENWWPVAHDLTKAQCVIDTKSLQPGVYRVQVLALNSIRVGTSSEVRFRVGKPRGKSVSTPEC